MNRVEVPVLIVGGGGAGLTASMLLSQLGVESLLVSSLPTTSILPKAHVLNQRCMEIFTDLGVAEEIYRRGTPAENMRYSAYYIGVAGDDPAYGRELGRLESWGAGGLDADWASASPCRQANLPQIRLEPILKARAEALAPGSVRFHHEVIDIEQDAAGERVPIAVQPSRGQSENRIARNNVVAIDELGAIDHAHGKPGQVILPVRIHRRHLSGFAADERAARLAAALRDAFHDFLRL